MARCRDKGRLRLQRRQTHSDALRDRDEGRALRGILRKCRPCRCLLPLPPSLSSDPCAPANLRLTAGLRFSFSHSHRRACKHKRSPCPFKESRCVRSTGDRWALPVCLLFATPALSHFMHATASSSPLLLPALPAPCRVRLVAGVRSRVASRTAVARSSGEPRRIHAGGALHGEGISGGHALRVTTGATLSLLPSLQAFSFIFFSFLRPRCLPFPSPACTLLGCTCIHAPTCASSPWGFSLRVRVGHLSWCISCSALLAFAVGESLAFASSLVSSSPPPLCRAGPPQAHCLSHPHLRVTDISPGSPIGAHPATVRAPSLPTPRPGTRTRRRILEGRTQTSPNRRAPPLFLRE